jgi:hypothetical protein
MIQMLPYLGSFAEYVPSAAPFKSYVEILLTSTCEDEEFFALLKI